jgi:hypothetical protein
MHSLKSVFRISLFVVLCLLAVIGVSCKTATKSNNKQIPAGWPQDVPLMPGLDLVWTQKEHLIMIQAVGTVDPGSIASFYQNLPGWKPNEDAASEWIRDQTSLPQFYIENGKYKILLTVQYPSDRKMDHPYVPGEKICLLMGYGEMTIPNGDK